MFSETFTPKHLAQLELLRLNARRAFNGVRHGNHTSLKRGHGMEFAEYRRYQLGDNPRHIDWGLYGRSDRMYVKTFQEEQNISVFLILDTSNSMLAEADSAKWQLTRDLFLSLAYIALSGQETVTICLPGTVTAFSCNGPRSIHRIAQLMETVKPCDPNVLSRSILSATSSLKVPGVALYLSDYLFDLEIVVRHLNILLSKNLEITTLQILGDKDREPLPYGEASRVIDSETGEEISLNGDKSFADLYAARLLKHQEDLKALTKKRRVKFASTDTRYSVMHFLSHSLTTLGVIS